jgi:hypothetical protein
MYLLMVSFLIANVSIVFSSIKKVLGENLLSKKYFTQKVDAGLKVMLYNRFISL